jgi:hypothetical protein
VYFRIQTVPNAAVEDEEEPLTRLRTPPARGTAAVVFTGSNNDEFIPIESYRKRFCNSQK